MRALFFALGLIASPAIAAPDQFDLVCTSGKDVTRYRVDLARNEACADTCDRVWKMGEATSGQLKLIDRTPAYRGDLEERSIVNRSTGAWHYTMTLRPIAHQKDGKCEAAPFSGFPAAKF